MVRRIFCVLLTSAALCGVAQAQPTFSIDWHSPLVGVPDSCFGIPMTEGDILAVALNFGPPAPGPLPPPCVVISGGFGPPVPGLMLPMHPMTLGHPAGVMGMVEVDAYSYGTDYAPKPGITHTFVDWYFSVDEFATGLPNSPLPPSVWNAGRMGWQEAAGDVFVDFGLSGGPICVATPATGNTEWVDGNGIAPFGGAGLGLIEPTPPVGGPLSMGSNLDGLDVDTRVLPGMPMTVYFSLDAAFVDPMKGVPNSGSAATIAPNIVGGDVLVSHVPGGPPVLYAPAALLGLDLFGPGTDDLDALALWENGTGVFEPPTGMYSWVNGQTDAIFFSLRRGSALVMNRIFDSRCGLPIEEGDILRPPLVAGLPPAIWIPAEALGLATVRSGTAIGPFGDELDALDVLCQLPSDVNGDGAVNLTDLSTLLAHYGIPAGMTHAMGDLDGDGDVDLTDLSKLLSQFGLNC